MYISCSAQSYPESLTVRANHRVLHYEMLKFSIYLLVLHNKSVESCSIMSGVSVLGILEVLLLAPLFVLDILVILCVLVTLVLLCVLDIIVLLCFLDILVLLCVLSYCYHMMCTELHSAMNGVSILRIIYNRVIRELSATSRFVQLWYQILLSVDLLVSQSCPEDDRSQPRRSSWSLLHLESLVYISHGCSISCVSPLREDGASTYPRDPGCSVSRVSLLLEPTREYGASAYKHLSSSKATVTLFIDPTGE